jgi:pimeloyl-ACP methyl ester carboxylesterase
VTATTDTGISDAELAAYRLEGPEPRARTVRVSDGVSQLDVRVMEFGEPGALPSVLLLHGIGSATVMAAPLLPALAGRHVLALDWPGHGLSGSVHVNRHRGVRPFAAAVVDSLLDTLGLDVVDVVAHSMGGQFALSAALERPQRFRRLVLLGAPGAAFVGVRPIPVMRLMSVPGLGRLLLLLPMTDQSFRQTITMSLGKGVVETLAPEVHAAAKLVGGRRANASSIASYFRALLKPGGRIRPGVAIPATELATLQLPVLLVWGSRDVFLTPEGGRGSIDAIPDARLLEVEAGHAPWLEHGEVVRSAVTEFLA